MNRDLFELERFVAAQDAHGTYAHALGELRAGAKRSHWMWFVFPQIAGLGASSMARRYAIQSLDEAKAYLEHPVLGVRFRECVSVLNALPTKDAVCVFGGIDAKKLRSSLTLFLHAAPGDEAITRALAKFFDGVADQRTLELLGVR